MPRATRPENDHCEPGPAERAATYALIALWYYGGIALGAVTGVLGAMIAPPLWLVDKIAGNE